MTIKLLLLKSGEDIIADVDYWSWERPEVFNKIEQAGDIEEKEMRKVFNLGIGFCTGIVEEGEILDGRMIKPGDVVIGIESSGLHSNGYSLINDMLWRHKLYYKDTPELLTPTTIYAPLIQDLLDEFPILGMAHITGGGIFENLLRCLPKGLTADIDYNVWALPKIFSKVMCAGEIPEEEMKRVFNLGIGYCLVVPEEAASEVQFHIERFGYNSWVIGNINKI